MIFTDANAKAVAAGRKTQTRHIPGVPRLAKRKDWQRRGLSATRMTTPWTPVVGHAEPVQPGRGKPAICHLIITEVRREPVGAITLEDAKAEGFASVAAFKVAWVRIHDSAWIAHHKVNLADALGPGVVRWILCERFDQEHAQTMVDAITFERAPADTQLLARPTRTSGDYVTSSARAIDLLPVVDAEYVAKKAQADHELWLKQKASFERDLAAERFERARREAEKAGLDTSGATRIVTRQAKALERAVERVSDQPQARAA